MIPSAISEEPKSVQERLRDHFAYDPLTGVVTRRLPVNRFRVGSIVGSDTGDGYLAMNFDGKTYKLHRVIWVLMTGDWPPAVVDHINHAKSDNRWLNLRSATRLQNTHNARLASTNKSGFKGVHFHKRMRKWIAKIRIHGRNVHLGSFDNPETAAEAYRISALKNFGEFSFIPEHGKGTTL